jgi:hypothetical protein
VTAQRIGPARCRRISILRVWMFADVSSETRKANQFPRYDITFKIYV